MAPVLSLVCPSSVAEIDWAALKLAAHYFRLRVCETQSPRSSHATGCLGVAYVVLDMDT